MQIKDVFVSVTPDDAGKVRLEFAADLAHAEGAHLTGAFFFDPKVSELSAVAAEYYLVGVTEETRNAEYVALVNRSDQGKSLFEEALRRNAVNGEWHVAHGLSDGIAKLARLSDLVIAGQVHPEDGSRSDESVLKCLLMESGRPVLVLPCYGKAWGPCRSVLIGWDGSREAARALHDAMPLLLRAQCVSLLSVERSSNDADLPFVDVAAHLSRHGINVTTARTTVQNLAISDALLNYAVDIAADVLVAGSYGHAPLQEAMFGGVTRELLQHMTLPILFSH